MISIVVFYEDARAPNGRFGPHEFVLGCVADAKRCALHELRERVSAVPVKGVGNLLKALGSVERLSRLAPNDARILAVIDQDRVRDHVGGDEVNEIERAIRARCSDPHRIEIALLERNLESVIRAIRECGETAWQLIEQALAKDLNARDILLGRVGNDPARRAIRDCVRTRVPSFDRLVSTVCAALG